MNETIQTLLRHRSIRAFTNKKVEEDKIHTIIKAAQMASSSSFYQAYTIIGVTDPKTKKELAKISGQSYVEDNGHLFVFCADLQRLLIDADHATQADMTKNLANTEHFIVATVDASLAAQNASIAAESLGLGICYIGSLRNDMRRVDELLALPPYVFPLFGMVLGYPEEIPEQKPRLPLEAIYHENTYKPLNEQEAYVKKYNEELQEYYQSRSQNRRLDTWTEQIHRKLTQPIRMDVTKVVKDKGLNHL